MTEFEEEINEQGRQLIKVTKKSAKPKEEIGIDPYYRNQDLNYYPAYAKDGYLSLLDKKTSKMFRAAQRQPEQFKSGLYKMEDEFNQGIGTPRDSLQNLNRQSKRDEEKKVRIKYEPEDSIRKVNDDPSDEQESIEVIENDNEKKENKPKDTETVDEEKKEEDENNNIKKGKYKFNGGEIVVQKYENSIRQRMDPSKMITVDTQKYKTPVYSEEQISSIRRSRNSGGEEGGEINDIGQPEDKDYYAKELLKEINKMRRDPQHFAKTIERNIKSRIITLNKLLYYSVEKTSEKIKLKKGKSAFDEAIKKLKAKNKKDLPDIKFNSNIMVEAKKFEEENDSKKKPNNENNAELTEEEEYDEKKVLKKAVDDLRGGGQMIKACWVEYCQNPEDAVILMLVDDSLIRKNGRKGDILLDKDISYMGISSNKTEDQAIIKEKGKKGFFCNLTFM